MPLLVSLSQWVRLRYPSGLHRSCWSNLAMFGKTSSCIGLDVFLFFCVCSVWYLSAYLTILGVFNIFGIFRSVQHFWALTRTSLRWSYTNFGQNRWRALSGGVPQVGSLKWGSSSGAKGWEEGQISLFFASPTTVFFLLHNPQFKGMPSRFLHKSVGEMMIHSRNQRLSRWKRAKEHKVASTLGFVEKSWLQVQWSVLERGEEPAQHVRLGHPWSSWIWSCGRPCERSIGPPQMRCTDMQKLAVLCGCSIHLPRRAHVPTRRNFLWLLGGPYAKSSSTAR